MDTVRADTPCPCQPFTGSLNATRQDLPMIITQNTTTSLTLPHAWRTTLAPHQMIKIRDATTSTLPTPTSGHRDGRLPGAYPAAILDEATSCSSHTGHRSQGQHATISTSSSRRFAAGLDLPGAKFFAITGTPTVSASSSEVVTAASPAWSVTPFYAPETFLCNSPRPTRRTNRSSRSPTTAASDFTCSTTTARRAMVLFGESAEQRDCGFFWAYITPF